jgi:hypothetical protein
MLRGKVTVGNDLIEFGEICNVDHRISAEFRVVRNYDHTLRTLNHSANRLNHKSAIVAKTIFSDAADSHDGNVSRDAVKHSFTNWAKLNAKARIEVSTGQSDLGLPALPKHLGNRDRIGYYLNRAIKKTSGHFGHSRSAPQDDGLPILDQIRCSLPDSYLFFVATHG